MTGNSRLNYGWVGGGGAYCASWEYVNTECSDGPTIPAVDPRHPITSLCF